LQAAIRALREELELQKMRHDDETRVLRRTARDEQKQLQETIAALREALEACRG
jgi:hypothetical protein